MLLIISAKCRIFQILSMIEEASGTRLYESKKEAAQKTIEKKDMKLKEIDSVICFKNSRVTQSSGVDGFDKCWKTKKKINKKLFHWSRLYKAKLFWSYSVLPRELIFTFFSSLFKTFAKLFGTVSLSDSASFRCYRVTVSVPLVDCSTMNHPQVVEVCISCYLQDTFFWYSDLPVIAVKSHPWPHSYTYLEWENKSTPHPTQYRSFQRRTTYLEVIR